jgi:hypothetical protein
MALQGHPKMAEPLWVWVPAGVIGGGVVGASVIGRPL